MRYRFHGSRPVRLPAFGLLVEPDSVIDVPAGTVLPASFKKIKTPTKTKDET